MERLQFSVKEETTLLPFLFMSMPKHAKNTVKNFLKFKMVYVNDCVVTQFNHPLKSGDIIVISQTLLKDIKKQQNFKLPFEVIFEDSEFIAINKPYGMLSCDEDEVENNTAYNYLKTFLQIADKNAKLFTLHRLDKDTSGVLVFTKDFELKEKLQANWAELVKLRSYIALVEGKMEQKKETIKSYLNDGKNTFVRTTKHKETGQEAITKYSVIKENKLFSLLEVNIETGRRNQIRVQLNEIGHPIVGDKKYGRAGNPIHRLGLHANLLVLIHPVSREIIRFEAKVPFIFYVLFKRKS